MSEHPPGDRDRTEAAPADLALDRHNLYLEETFTDLKVGIVKRLTPVTVDGLPDKGRKPIFIGETHLETPHGPLPIQAPIPAKELAQAIKRFPEAIEAAMRRLSEELRKMKEAQAGPRIETPESRIIIP